MFKLLFIPIILLSAFFGTNQTMIASTHEPITQIEFTTKIANLEKLWERKAAQAHNQLIKTQLEAQIVHHETFQKAIRRYKFFSFSKVATGSLQALGNTFCGY